MNWKDKNVIVFGGGGFLGRYIVEQLLELGAQVSSFGRSKQPELEALGVDVICGDMRDSKSVDNACSGKEMVFLTAAKAGVWGKWNEYYCINVLGAENVLNACKKNQVKSLIYTSSPSVAYSAEKDIENMDENNPYPEKYLGNYPKSKAIAEKMILAANSKSLKTVSLRPHLIWGPRDPHLIPRVMEAGRNGKLMIVGNEKSKVDMTYVVNGASAHIKAAEALNDAERCGNVEGKAYFISDDAPVELWTWINQLFEKNGIPQIKKSLSYKKAYGIGIVLEGIYKCLPFLGEPRMTRFIAGQLGHSHYFDISAAKRDFGYSIVVDPNAGLDNLLKSIKST